MIAIHRTILTAEEYAICVKSFIPLIKLLINQEHHTANQYIENGLLKDIDIYGNIWVRHVGILQENQQVCNVSYRTIQVIQTIPKEQDD